MADEIEEPEVEEESEEETSEDNEDNWARLQEMVRTSVKEEITGLDIPGQLKKAIGGIKWPSQGGNNSKQPSTEEQKPPARSDKPKNTGILGSWF